MEDQDIIQLYWDRDGQAIQATSEKYGAYCTAIARHIVCSAEDAEECVNDTYLKAWNAMPDQRPTHLAAFLGRIVRNTAFNRYSQDRAQKRGGGELPLVLEELGECVSGREDVEAALDRQELAAAISAFVRALPEEKRRMFVCRYWYAAPVSAIAKEHGRRRESVSKALERMWQQLRAYLTERGFDL